LCPSKATELTVGRRKLLRAAGLIAGAALTAPITSGAPLGHTRFSNYPFSLGVDSGDPVSDGFVLWTRLAPDPVNGGGMPPEAVPVRWEVAQEERFHLAEPETLEGYRNLHALYKTDTHLQAAHAWHPFAVMWDDHEVDNDYAKDQSEERTPAEQFLRRRAAAYQAYYEHMPLRRSAQPVGPDMTLYTSLNFGDLASIAMLDDRQY
jgi:phosphodiesterase/alkaline phosphatase D-like protein